MSAAPRVAVIGGFGRGDVGAEARLAGVVAAFPDLDLVAMSGDPARTHVEHGCDVVRASVPTLAQLLRGEIDALLVAGGDAFGAGGATDDGRFATGAVLAARARRIPTVLLGVGIAGGARRYLDRGLARAADLVLLRDAESASLLAAAGVPAPFRVAADPSWSFARDAAPPADTVRGSGHVAVVVDGSLGLPHARAVGDALAGVDRPVEVLPWRASHEDVEFARAVASRRADVEVLDPPTRFEDVVKAVADAELTITHRAHAAITAAAAERSVLCIGSRPELAGVARALGRPHVPAHAAPAVLQRSVALAVAAEPPSTSAADAMAQRVEDAAELAGVVLGVREPSPDLGTHLDLVGGQPAW